MRAVLCLSAGHAAAPSAARAWAWPDAGAWGAQVQAARALLAWLPLTPAGPAWPSGASRPPVLR